MESKKELGICLYCGNEFLKSCKTQRFCCNSKTTENKGNCKDNYWNEKSKKEYIKKQRLINPSYCNKKNNVKNEKTFGY